MLGIAVALSLGLCRHPQPRPGPVLRRRRLHARHVAEAREPTSLQQGSDKPVPDFMLWNAEPGSQTDLCCINKASFLWIPFQNQWFGVAMGIVLPVCIAAVLGIIMFRKRIAGVFVSDHHAGPGSAGAASDHRRAADHQRLQRPDRSRLVQAVRLRVRSLFATQTYYLVAGSLAILCPGRRASSGRNPRRPDPAGDPRRPEPRALSRLRRAALSRHSSSRSRRHRGIRRHALRHRRGVCLADLHGPELLDHHGGVGGGRRPRARSSAPASAPS